MNEMILEETLRGGAMWSCVLKRGTSLRLTDVEGCANVSAVFYNADMALERYNMPDTLKAQFTAFLTKGRVLHSDMGRVLCSITEDACGWHDTFCGVIDGQKTLEKFGPTSYQQQRNEFYRNGKDNFLIELGKHGLGKRDLHANVNFFSKVVTDDDGNLRFVPGHSKAGAYVDLRAEMNVLVILSNTPHPLAPSGKWNPPPVKIFIRKTALATADDFCRNSRPENVRGFINTEALFR